MSSEQVAVGFSGGKDSTAAALLLKQRGCTVEAVTLRLGVPGEEERLQACSRLAERIDIPHRVVDARDAFQRFVVRPFLKAYAAGITPNPCAACNAGIKFDLLMDTGRSEGARLLATGHYARLEHEGERCFLIEPREKSKSQIYFLALVQPERMRGVCFPLGDATMDEVIELTRDLPLAGAKSSQDICFLGGENLETYLRRHVPDAFRPGPILNVRGEEIGEHRGTAAVTIGQRRGLGFAGEKRLYVLGLDMSRNAVILGEANDLERREIKVLEPVYWRSIEPGEELAVRIRYASPPSRAVVTRADAQTIHAQFHAPVRAVTPGQVGVFYQNERIVAAGTIAGNLE